MLKRKGTKDPYARMGFGLDCNCWNNRSHKVFTESEKEILRQALKEQGMKESDIDEAIENYRKTVEACCSTHKDPDGNTRRGEKANIIVLGEAQDDTIGYVGCVYFSTPNNGAVGGRYIVYAP
jgi:hypothetical protein